MKRMNEHAYEVRTGVGNNRIKLKSIRCTTYYYEVNLTLQRVPVAAGVSFDSSFLTIPPDLSLCSLK